MANKYRETTKDVLLCLFVAGAIMVAATSPYFLINIARQIKRNKKYIKKEIKRKLDERKIAKALERLKRNKLIILGEENGNFKVELTKKGKRVVKKIQLDDMKPKKPTVWDKKWRIVIFDIPDKKRRARDALREKLQKMHFYPLQKSVWVHPYHCEKEIQFLCEFFEITPYVNIIVADNIYDDIKLRKYFNLL